MTDFNQKTHDTDVGSHGGKSRQMADGGVALIGTTLVPLLSGLFG